MVRRRSGVLVPVLGVLLLSVVLYAAPAAATSLNCTAIYGQHCYGEAMWRYQANAGGKTQLYVTSGMYVQYESPYTDHINQELWVFTNNSEFSWVEVGYKLGYAYKNGYSVNQRWFWAESRPDGKFTEHIPTNVGNVWDYWGTYVWVDAYSISSTQWKIDINNTQVGISSQPCCSIRLESGSEATDAGSRNDPNSTGPLQWLSYGGWGNGWTYNGNNAVIGITGPGYFYWYIPQVIGINGQN